jgi:hypothetical protein
MKLEPNATAILPPPNPVGNRQPAPETNMDTLIRLKQAPGEWYIEWWKLGTPEKDINCATFSTINIKHFYKTFSKHKHLSMVFLRRECDHKVMYDRRSN